MQIKLTMGFNIKSRELALNSPYFEAVKKNDNEVLFLFESHDETVILILNEFKRKHLIGIEQQSQKDQNKDDLIIEGDARSLK
jgi:HSP90 family molecular chaperone